MKEKKYKLYIGLNDKETNQQKMRIQEAKEIINEICLKHSSGYTVTEANGGWIDKNNCLTKENTLIYEINQRDIKKIYHIMDDVLEQLNQQSIMMEDYDGNISYYPNTN